MYDINQRVGKLRKSHLITQEQFAKLLNYRTSTYSQMERSGKIPAEILKKISEILDVDIRYFLYGEEFLEIKEEKVSEPPEQPKPQDIYELLETDERNIIITYRNLSNKEKQEAYSLFMENFNLNTLHQKKREEKYKKRIKRELKKQLS